MALGNPLRSSGSGPKGIEGFGIHRGWAKLRRSNQEDVQKSVNLRPKSASMNTFFDLRFPFSKFRSWRYWREKKENHCIIVRPFRRSFVTGGFTTTGYHFTLMVLSRRLIQSHLTASGTIKSRDRTASITSMTGPREGRNSQTINAAIRSFASL